MRAWRGVASAWRNWLVSLGLLAVLLPGCLPTPEIIGDDSADDDASQGDDDASQGDDDATGDDDDASPRPVDFDRDGYTSDVDCDDHDPAVHPGATDFCDGIDDDCDGVIDNGPDRETWYQDGDVDGYGNNETTLQSCSSPAGYASTGGDCNDGDASIHPQAAESCNGQDENCNGSIDEGVLQDFYPDADGDGYGAGDVAPLADCAPPDSSYVTENSDCDDVDASSYPGAFEACDGIDHNCSGTTSTVANELYPDVDLDGYGDPAGAAVSGCEASTGRSLDQLDCDDSDPAIHPVLVDQATGSSSGDGSQQAPMSSVQQGINYPTSCALVLVNPGAYMEPVEITSRQDLVLRSVWGAEQTTLQASKGRRPLSILNSSDVTIQGFSIQALDPVSGLGAAVYVGSSSNIQLTNLLVHDSITADSNSGGGLGIELSDAVYLTESTVQDNSAYDGGGLAASSSNVTVSNCTFSGNLGRDGGGGAVSLKRDSSSPNSKVSIDHCTFTGNYGVNLAGGAGADQDQDLVVSDSTFVGNVVTNGYGGALYNPSLVQRCVFTENLSTGDNLFASGGAIMLRQNATLANSILMGNEATYAGGVDLNEFSGMTSTYKIVNNTFVDNKAYNNLGESLYVYAADSVVIRNNIFLDIGGDNSNVSYNLVSALSWVIEYNDVYIDAGKAFLGFGGWDDSLLSKYSNKAIDPKFVAYDEGQYATADLHLGSSSPCINTGNPVVGLDPDGTAPDMGAFGGPAATW